MTVHQGRSFCPCLVMIIYSVVWLFFSIYASRFHSHVQGLELIKTFVQFKSRPLRVIVSWEGNAREDRDPLPQRPTCTSKVSNGSTNLCSLNETTSLPYSVWWSIYLSPLLFFFAPWGYSWALVISRDDPCIILTIFICLCSRCSKTKEDAAFVREVGDV